MLLMADDVLWRNYRDRTSENTFLHEHVVVGRAQQDFYVEQKREGPATGEPGVCWPSQNTGPMANAPVSLGVFFLITHHSSHDKAPSQITAYCPRPIVLSSHGSSFQSGAYCRHGAETQDPRTHTHIYGHPKP